jgi:hypothetical protein
MVKQWVSDEGMGVSMGERGWVSSPNSRADSPVKTASPALSNNRGLADKPYIYVPTSIIIGDNQPHQISISAFGPKQQADAQGALPEQARKWTEGPFLAP